MDKIRPKGRNKTSLQISKKNFCKEGWVDNYQKKIVELGLFVS